MARIAIVDDSRLARTFALTVLRKAGHDAFEIDPLSIFEVLKVLREAPPRILIMDYLMPGCPGNSLVRACREDPVLEAMKVVVCTAHRDEDVKERLDRLGVSAFLHKPLDPAALLELVESLAPAEG
ncbi:MAG: Chemotaxis protein CheY [Acidobacteria bacterium ADurb.Bin340]|jgi:CheY-like chemotaxis protein|nr:MAG: Chemotaxis protein CheY [Acidobacteria bacterium ADurb.Bin340]HQL49366.1 response regulator [Holophaga sp.]